ncbi:MAG TPA: PaaI family thioesterase [Solirubrobacteraceae bacterium]|jgi:1,4-dihydroxy-2-naphthoyl-CoA hydrolase|nr:PaaI family thioesterase [Solirubrobacteraceae bacterium]
MADAPYLPPVAGLDALLGLQLLSCEDDVVRAVLAVREEVRQPFGLVHGGVFAAIAEALASIGTAIAVVPDGSAPMGMSNNTSFLRPVTEGTIHARAVRRHRGRTTWLWDVEMTDDDGRLCAITRMTIAVRPLPGSPSRDSGS